MIIHCAVCGNKEIDAPPHPLYKFGPRYFCGFWHYIGFITRKYVDRLNRERMRKRKTGAL